MKKFIIASIVTIFLVSCASTVEQMRTGVITPTAIPTDAIAHSPSITITPTQISWSRSTSLIAFKEMAILSDTEVWAMSNDGTIIHSYPRYLWDVRPYEYPGEFNLANGDYLTAMYFNSKTDGWLTSWYGGQIFHWDGQKWNVIIPDERDNHWYDINFANSKSGWLVGCYYQDGHYFPAMQKWNGVEWQDVSLIGLAGMDYCLAVVDAVSETDAWVIAQNRPNEGTCLDGGPIILLHWNGVEWEKIATPARIRGWGCSGWGKMSASGVSDVWLINSLEDTIAHWNGSDWGFTILPFGFFDQVGDTQPSVLALSPNNVWVGGRALFHWDGNKWLDAHYDTDQDYIVDLKSDLEGNVWALTRLGGILKLSIPKK